MEIRVISLLNSSRRPMIKNTLANISFTFHDAVNLTDNPDNFIFKLYNSNKTQKNKGYTLTNAELGCFASHIELWQQSRDSGEVFLIFEDNIECHDNIAPHLETIEALTNTYGIVKLSNIFKRKHIKIETINDKYSLISHLKGACGTSAYAISPHVAGLYLEKVNGFFEPIDDFMDNEWFTNQTLYSYYPPLISRSNVNSEIGNRKFKGTNSIINKISIEAYRLKRQALQYIYNKMNK